VRSRLAEPILRLPNCLASSRSAGLLECSQRHVRRQRSAIRGGGAGGIMRLNVPVTDASTPPQDAQKQESLCPAPDHNRHCHPPALPEDLQCSTISEVVGVAMSKSNFILTRQRTFQNAAPIAPALPRHGKPKADSERSALALQESTSQRAPKRSD